MSNELPMTMKKTDKILKEKVRSFAKHVVQFSNRLRKKKESVLAAQFLRSGTSIGANIAEGRYAHTRGNYISKHAIALAEAGETLYWIELFVDSGFAGFYEEFDAMQRECEQIVGVLDRLVRHERRVKAQEEAEQNALRRRRREETAQA